MYLDIYMKQQLCLRCPSVQMAGIDEGQIFGGGGRHVLLIAVTITRSDNGFGVDTEPRGGLVGE
jgi:hypothetical protein